MMTHICFKYEDAFVIWSKVPTGMILSIDGAIKTKNLKYILLFEAEPSF